MFSIIIWAVFNHNMNISCIHCFTRKSLVQVKPIKVSGIHMNVSI